MAPQQVLSSRVTPEGRALVPAPIRQILGALPGSRIAWIVDETGVRVVSDVQAAHELWAANTGGDAQPVAEDVRALRDEDQLIDDAIDDEPDTRTPEEITAGLFGALGLPAPVTHPAQ